MKSESQPPSSQPAKPKSKSGILRLVIALFVGGMVLLVGGVYIVTSSWFVSGTILPMAGGSMNSKMEASKVSGLLSSSVEVTDFRLTPNEEETFVSVKRLSVGYDLMAIINGKVTASDFVAEQLVVELVMKADGSLNIDPILEALSGPAPAESEPPSVDLQRLKIQDGTVRFRQEGKDTDGAVYELTGLNVEVDRLGNGSSTVLKMGGAIGIRMTEGGQTSEFAATLDESITISWNDELLPVSFESAVALVVGKVSGVFAEFAENRVEVSGKLENNELNPLLLKVSKADLLLGSLSVSGPLNVDEGSADLQFELADLNQNLLNQFKDLVGFSFGEPTVSASGGLTLAAGGEALAFDVTVSGNQFSLQNAGAQTPPLSFELVLAMAADLAGSVFDFQTLSLNATQSGRPLLSVSAAKPMKVSLSGSGLKMADTKLDLTVSDLNLADWRAVLGEAAVGRVASTLSISSEGDQGGSIQIGGKVQLANLVQSVPGDIANGLGLNATLKAKVSDLKNLDVSELKFQVNNAQGQLLDGGASLSLGDSGVLTFKTELKVANPAKPGLTPLELGVEAAGRLDAAKTEFDSIAFTFPSTSKSSQNRATLSGSLSPDPVKGLSGDLRLASKSLDLTPLMDFYDGLASAETASENEPSPSTEPAKEGEPEPIDLPVNRLNATLQFDQLFAREIVVSDWLTEVAVEKNGIRVSPLTLTLNGAPVKGHANVDLSVPGYRYDLALETSQLPAGPFIGSLNPTLKGVYDGMLDVVFDVDGAGVTGVNLKKNLKGMANLDFKGANIELFDSWKKLFMTPVALVLRVPAMLDSPIQGLSLQSSFGDGTVNLGEFKVLSPQFEVVSTGAIPIADDLMASALALPIDLTMKKDLALGANLVDEEAEVTEGFVKLPPFVSVEGSVGTPKVNIDKLAVGKLFIRNVAGLPESVVGQAGDVIQGLGGLVGGKGGDKNAAGKLINGVGGLLGGEKGAGIKDAGNALRGLFNRGNKEEKK
jgi:hypothetical protein